MEKAKLLAKQHADETDRIRKQQAEDKRALVEARSRILKQKAAEEEQKLMAERLRKMEAENMRLKQMETDHIKLKKDLIANINCEKKCITSLKMKRFY